LDPLLTTALVITLVIVALAIGFFVARVTGG
jgi:hypothetical protein